MATSWTGRDGFDRVRQVLNASSSSEATPLSPFQPHPEQSASSSSTSGPIPQHPSTAPGQPVAHSPRDARPTAAQGPQSSQVLIPQANTLPGAFMHGVPGERGGVPGFSGAEPSHSPVELTLKDRAVAAGTAAVLSALLMNPLDVAKTRLQAQAAGFSYSQSSANVPCNTCGSPWPDPITRRHLSSYQMSWVWDSLHPKQAFQELARDAPHMKSSIPSPVHMAALLSADSSASCAVSCEFPAPAAKAYRGPLDVFLRVIREEGPLRLWRGTNAGLIMAVPSVGIYMPVYDTLRVYLERGADGAPLPSALYAAVVAGAASRSLASVVCAPLELARTRIQAAAAAGAGGEVVQLGILQTMRAAVEVEVARKQHRKLQELDAAWESGAVRGMGAATSRVSPLSHLSSYRVLWRGVDAHLARDVPFSAICWGILEPVRKWLLQVELSRKEEWRGVEEEERQASLAQILGANFGAGLMSGSLAVAVTTPLDVAKTRVQIEIFSNAARRGVAYHLKEIFREGGWRALYTGGASNHQGWAISGDHEGCPQQAAVGRQFWWRKGSCTL